LRNRSQFGEIGCHPAICLIGVTLAIASMIWFLSRELAVTYAEAFRKVSFPRE